MSLSVCIIVKNEQEVIARCLDCVSSFADEIIVVDTGSTDKTAEIAGKYTDKIFSFEWRDNFSDARNFAFEKACCEFVMWLDADDVVTKENQLKITQLLKKPDFDTAFLLYAAGFEGDKPTLLYYRERIFRRSINPKFIGAVHEVVVPYGKTVYSDIEIQHRKIKSGNPLRNLSIYQKLISGGKQLDPREKFYYGRELLFNGMYRECISVLENFLAGEGWVENKIEACLNLYYAYIATGEEKNAYAVLLNSFLYAPPRSEPCCLLGDRALKLGDMNSAKFWYERALGCDFSVESGGFCNVDFCGFIPCMQLCVVYDRLGEYETACEYNERAGRIKPDDKGYLYNRRYFTEKLNNKV